MPPSYKTLLQPRTGISSEAVSTHAVDQTKIVVVACGNDPILKHKIVTRYDLFFMGDSQKIQIIPSSY